MIPIKCDGSKSPALRSWKSFQSRCATEDQVRVWFSVAVERGVAIVCGAISQLEVLDFDQPEYFDQWRDLIVAADPTALKHVAIIETPRGTFSRHCYIRRVKPAPSQKLAQRWTLHAEGLEAQRGRAAPARETCIETRGEGGYVVAPGSPPASHSSGRTYRHVAGPTIEQVRAEPPLSDAHYELCLNTARALSPIVDPPRDRSRRSRTTLGARRPGDEFNRRATWSDILSTHGWTLAHGDGVAYSTWTRPGKAGRGTSATTGRCSSEQSGDLLYVFSTNAAPFEAGCAYSKFTAFALLEHGGDFKAAARALRSIGYGERVCDSAQPHLAAGDAPRPGANSADGPANDDKRPVVPICAGEMPSVAEKAEELLRAASSSVPVIYQRLGGLVRVVRIEQSVKGRVSFEAGANVIRAVDEHYLMDQLARVARFVRFAADGAPIACHPPRELAYAIQSHAGAWKFPLLSGIVEAPQLFDDGRVLATPGYDSTSGLLLDMRGVEFVPIPHRPSKDDAHRALELLERELLGGFPFLNVHDRSAAAAMLLTAVGRSAFGQGPAFGVDAPNRSCGKSTLLAIPSVLATGRRPTLIDPGTSAEEADKRILTVLIEGHRHVCFDNLNSAAVLDVPAIAKALTEPTFTGRVLGKSETMTIPTTGVTWSYGGINLDPRGDTVSRSVLIRLDLQVEQPWRHAWRTPDPVAVALERRGELLPAALTVLKAFMIADRPRQAVKPFRFGEWSGLVQHALVWLDRPDPLSRLEELESNDPEIQPLIAIMDLWWEAIGARAVTVADVLLRARLSPELTSALHDVAAGPDGQPDARRLGKYLSRFARRIVGGKLFVRAGNSGTRARWVLQPAVSAGSAVGLLPSQGITLEGVDADGEFDLRKADCENCSNCGPLVRECGDGGTHTAHEPAVTLASPGRAIAAAQLEPREHDGGAA
ncbi:MAG: bifunctional DNA primase/polymerase [Planctomycetes bacterium]|nr:bifunctional DNA primase/polymerase [Planctomycetota bacterium]